MSLPAPAATVTGTVAAYAGGSILARFISQGAINSNSLIGLEVSATLDASGSFSITAWNNSYVNLSPSTTQFTIALGGTSYTVLVLITSQSQDISTELSAAPLPPLRRS
jgi:hypothetical protein